MTLETDLAKLERQVLGIRRVSTWLEAVESIRRLLETHPAEVRQLIVRMAAPKIGTDLAAAVLAAFDLGVVGGARDAHIDPPTTRAPKTLATAAPKADRDIAELVAKARKLARAGVEPEVALSPLLGAAASAKRNVTTLINTAGNEGVLEAARVAGTKVVWVAETNACVQCLEYSGEVVKAGAEFPKALTRYSTATPYDGPGRTPPLHPNCRCTLEVLNAPEYAEALRREADRSVLRGFSLESESMRVRVAAAERLLEQPDLVAPKSVIAYARGAVKGGEFTTRGRPAA